MNDRLQVDNWNAESLFTIGVVVLVCAYMLAVIDGAAVARARSARAELELDFRDENASMIDELAKADREILVARQAVSEAKDSPAADPARRADAMQALDAAEQIRSRKLAEVQHASRLFKLDHERSIDRNILSQTIDSDANSYWYAWLQLPGFLCLFVGSVAFLKSESGVKRVTASIILAISLSVLVMLHLVPGALRSQSLFNLRGGNDVTNIEDERDDLPRRSPDFRR